MFREASISRLALMRSKAGKPLLLAALLLVLTGLSACRGEDRSNLIPPDSAEQITVSIDRVQTQVDGGLCFEALDSAGRVQKRTENLPQSVDPELSQSLLDGAVSLIQLVRDNCEDSAVTATGDESANVKPEPEIATTGETGSTGSTVENRPDKPKETPEANPETPGKPDLPTTPEQPNTPGPPVNTGPGSGGITPNQ